KRSLSIAKVGNRLLVHCFAGCSVQDICHAVGLTVADLFTESTEYKAAPDWSVAERREYARRLWQQSRYAAGTVVQKHLRRRGITTPPPPSIRFLSLFDHREYGWAFPVMMAGIQDLKGNFAGISMTWLSADGSGKAPVDPPRKIFGAFFGGSVRLAPAGE